MKELYNRIMQRIEEMRAQPIPRWVFVARRIGIWVALVLSVILGAFTLAYMVYAAQQADVAAVAGADPLAPLMTLLPVWLLVFALFVGLALWGIEQTERGYKVPLTLWIVANIAVTGVGALALAAAEVPARMDPIVERHLEPLSAAGLARPLWERPGAGRVQGRITTVSTGSFLLEDPRGDTWQIQVREQTRVRVPVEVEKRVGVLGRPAGDKVIEAREVVPLRRPVPPREGPRPGPRPDRFPEDGRPVPPPPRPAR